MTLFVLQFFPNFLLIFCRITAFFVVAPLFSSKTVPVKFKVGIAFFMTLITFTSLGMEEPIPIDTDFYLSIFREVAMGLVLGYLALLFFTAVQVAGSFIDFQIGFALANVIDPMTGAQAPIFGNFKYYLAILMFLALNAHHFLIQGIMNSYEFVPLNGQLFASMESGSVSNFIIDAFSTMFMLAFQMAAPFVVVVFMLDVVLGIMAKTTPQLNIFVVGIPLKIIFGFVVFILTASGLVYIFSSLFNDMFDAMYQLMKIIQSGS
jgi:flagellar biosynthetic protein FliR